MRMIIYLDDMLVVCNSQEELRECVLLIKDFRQSLKYWDSPSTNTNFNGNNDNMCLLQCLHQYINQELCYIAS